MSMYGELAYFHGNHCAHVEAYEEHMLKVRRRRAAALAYDARPRYVRNPVHVMHDTIERAFSGLRSCA